MAYLLLFSLFLSAYLPQATEIRSEVVNNALNFLRDRYFQLYFQSDFLINWLSSLYSFYSIGLSSGTILCLLYPAKIIAMGAVFLSILKLNILPIESSVSTSSTSQGLDQQINNPSTVNVAYAWYELLKNDISIDILMGNYLNSSSYSSYYSPHSSSDD